MKINNCFLGYSPICREHTVSTECKKPETALKRFSAVFAELLSTYRDKIDSSAFVSALFSSNDFTYRLGDSFRKHYSTPVFTLAYGYSFFISFDLTFRDDVYIMSFIIHSEDTSDTTEDTSDTTEDTSDTTEDTSDTTEDTSDTTEDTSDTTEDTKDTTTIILGALDSVQVKRSVVKPVPFSSSFLEVRIGGEYPFIVVLPDGSKMWDCRQSFYNTYLCELLGAPPDGELPF